MDKKVVKVINNSNAVKYAAGVRLDPGINKIAPEDFEDCKQTAAWEKWIEEEQIEIWRQNKFSTSGKSEKRTKEFTVNDIPLEDFTGKEQDKKRQEIFAEKYKDEDWLERQILGHKAAGHGRSEAIEHIAEWCGVTPRTIRRWAP